jgi:hypothetical protein
MPPDPAAPFTYRSLVIKKINEFNSGFNTDSPHILHMKFILW